MTIEPMEPKDIGKLPTKTRILDAAEQLFATHGYHGVSIREITQLAGVELGLAHYHFGPKHELFRHVVLRRIGDHCDGVLKELDQVEEAARPGVPAVEDIVRALCRFNFMTSASGDPGWRRYFLLLAHSAQLPFYEPVMASLNKPYGVIIRRYTDAFRRALPSIQPGNLATAFYLLQGIVTRLVAETELLERQSRGVCRAQDFDSHMARVVPFVAAGFYALAGRPELTVVPSDQAKI